MLVVGHGGPKWISPSLAKQMDICRIGTDLKAEDMLKQEDPYLHREAGTAQGHARDLHRGSCVMAFWRDRKHIEGASAEELRVSLWGLALGASQRREKYARKAPAGASAGSRLRSASWQNREDRQGDGAGMRQPGAGAAVLLKLAHAAWGCSAAEGTDANDEHMALNAGVLVLGGRGDLSRTAGTRAGESSLQPGASRQCQTGSSGHQSHEAGGREAARETSAGRPRAAQAQPRGGLRQRRRMRGDKKARLEAFCGDGLWLCASCNRTALLHAKRCSHTPHSLGRDACEVVETGDHPRLFRSTRASGRRRPNSAGCDRSLFHMNVALNTR
ncbi:unnamed protein product [Symbiodinium necroappetens]|uniref:Uncharacterized protein n=1 Tax=Symbiodinium necroappetens TaxID=1628268 RepID=A0A812P8D0_9DINO|nr:unnamed protein product [Symbiodinium necroappetens]